MALIDYIPGVLFFMAMYSIIKDIKEKMGTISKIMMCAVCF